MRTPGHKDRDFESFEATSLHCPKCGGLVPVVKRLLLVLPDGELFEYLCQRCMTQVGKKRDREKGPSSLIIS